MQLENNNFTKLTIEQSEIKGNIEFPYEDVGIDEMIDAFNTLMIGITFTQKTIYRGLAQWLLDNAGEYYEIKELSNNEDDE